VGLSPPTGLRVNPEHGAGRFCLHGWMRDYQTHTYGDRIAAVYDERLDGRFEDTPGAVELLASLAGSGPVLELGIGTGRLALPLAERGLEVHGIDASVAMVARLRAKPGGERIPVTIGDFADVGVDGTYPLVFVAFNTFFALASQDDQVRCFSGVAAHLAADGVFVIEAFVPDVTRLAFGHHPRTERVDIDAVELSASHHDPVRQVVESQHVVIGERGTSLYPVRVRYAWPSELDLMARLAGLRLRERWGTWRRETFGAASPRHVSIYERGETPEPRSGL
jgi:SAM-dependent methyltransferase